MDHLRTPERRNPGASSRLGAILNAITDFAGTADVEGNTLFINDSGRKLLNLAPRANVAGIPFSTWFASSAVAPLIGEARDCATRDGSWHGKSILLTTDGREIPVSHALLDYSEEEGNAAFLSICSARSATLSAPPARVAEPPTPSSNSFWSLFDSITESVSIQRRDRTFLDMNSAFLKMYGYRRDEVIGKLPEMLLDGERSDFRSSMALFNRALAGEPQRLELWGRRSDGECFPQELSLTRGSWSGEDVVVSVAREVSDQRNLEQQLRQAQKMEAVGRLAGGVAHDFNNILTVIRGNAEILQSDLGEDDPRLTEVVEIEKATRRAAELTHQLLAFSRRQVLLPKVLNLNVVLSDMEKMLHRLIGEDVELRVTLDPDLRTTLADPGQVQQVVMNLVLNARDAMPRGGRLSLETGNRELTSESLRRDDVPSYIVPGSYVSISVGDTGTGIDRNTMNRLFEPFFTTKAPGKGTGLGLSTVYGIIKQSDGFVWAESAINEGSTFRVLLPVIEHESEGARAPQPSVAQSEKDGTETILLVEDEGSVRKLIARILIRAGYTVLEAVDGEEAFRICARYDDPIDLVLTDVIMPGLSGPEVAAGAELMRPEAKVFYMSGYTDDELGQHGVTGREMHFLQKPFSSETLLARIRKVLDGEE